MIYLDHAATTPVLPAVADAMYTVLREQFANPSAQYRIGLEMKKQVRQWREIIAGALECDPARLYFTSCGTEGDYWAIRAGCYQNRHAGKHIVTTAMEHSAVLETCRRMEQEGYQITRIRPETDGSIPPEKILSAVTDQTALVSVMLVNNETGNLYDIAAVSRGLRVKNPRTLLHTDAVQGFLKVPCAVRTLGVDFMTVCAHKIGGPKGIGALYIGPRIRTPRPMLPGGGQENGLRSGTEATAQIAGFAKAVEQRQATFSRDAAHLEQLHAFAAECLRTVPDMTLIGGTVCAAHAPHIIAAALSGWPSENIINDLSEQGIYISAGSACHRGRPSHVTAALNLPPRTAKSVIRLSFGPDTTLDEIRQCADALRRHHDTRMPML